MEDSIQKRGYWQLAKLLFNIRDRTKLIKLILDLSNFKNKSEILLNLKHTFGFVSI